MVMGPGISGHAFDLFHTTAGKYTCLRCRNVFPGHNPNPLAHSQSPNSGLLPDFQMQHQQAAVSHLLERPGQLAQGLQDLFGRREVLHTGVAVVARRHG